MKKLYVAALSALIVLTIFIVIKVSAKADLKIDSDEKDNAVVTAVENHPDEYVYGLQGQVFGYSESESKEILVGSYNLVDDKLVSYNGFYYGVTKTSDADYVLLKISKDGSYEEVCTLASNPSDHSLISDSKYAFTVKDNYLYFIRLICAPERIVDYIATFECCRLNLDDSAGYEVLGKFEAPGDSYGLAITANKSKVVFANAAEGRLYVSPSNTLQVNMYSYSLDNGTFKEEVSYFGSVNYLLFEGGFPRFYESGFALDDNNNMYFPGFKGGNYSNYIIRYNLDTKESSIFHVCEKSGVIGSVAADSDYVYVVESAYEKSDDKDEIQKVKVVALNLSGEKTGERSFDYGGKIGNHTSGAAFPKIMTVDKDDVVVINESLVPYKFKGTSSSKIDIVPKSELIK